MSWVLPVVTALIGAAGGLAAAVLADRLRRRRGMPDRDQVREWLFFFNRPAWKGQFIWHSDLDQYAGVLAATRKAINTGMLETRSGKELEAHRVLGASHLADRQLRDAMIEIVSRIERIEAMVKAVQEEERLKGNASALRGQSAEVIDVERDAVVLQLNDIARRCKLDPLPLPTCAKHL